MALPDFSMRQLLEAGVHFGHQKHRWSGEQGAHGIGEGIDVKRADEEVNKFWPEGLLIVHAGGQAGLFSAICAGWTGGRFRHESKPVTREIVR